MGSWVLAEKIREVSESSVLAGIARCARMFQPGEEAQPKGILYIPNGSSKVEYF